MINKKYVELADGSIVEFSEEDYKLSAMPSVRPTERNIRGKRDELLRELDNTISNPLRWEALSTEQQQVYRVYRQTLLDVPQQVGFPTDVVWPTSVWG
jgi:hypothetical protein